MPPPPLPVPLALPSVPIVPASLSGYLPGVAPKRGWSPARWAPPQTGPAEDGMKSRMSRSACPNVRPAKAGAFSGVETHRGKS